MAIAHVLLTIPLLAGTGTPPDQSLDLAVVDTSAFPSIVVDLVVPSQYSAVEITAAMLDIDGAPVDSVALVDPADVAMVLVLDDRPTIDAADVTMQQGGAVELARNLGEGTATAVATPSGLQTAFTIDRGATIARIAGITAGAPDVVPMPDLLLAATALVAAHEQTDRNLVVVLGADPELSEAQSQALNDAIVAARARLHVVAPTDVDVGVLDDLAARTGGVFAPVDKTVAGTDQVTAAIVDRYRIGATVDGPGAHELGLDVDGSRLTATVDAGAGPPAPAPASTTPGSAAATTAPDASGTTAVADEQLSPPAGTTAAAEQLAPPVRTTTGASVPAATPASTSAAADPSSGSTSVPLIAAVVLMLLLAGVAVYLVLGMRPTKTGRTPAPTLPDLAPDASITAVGTPQPAASAVPPAGALVVTMKPASKGPSRSKAKSKGKSPRRARSAPAVASPVVDPVSEVGSEPAPALHGEVSSAEPSDASILRQPPGETVRRPASVMSEDVVVEFVVEPDRPTAADTKATETAVPIPTADPDEAFRPRVGSSPEPTVVSVDGAPAVGVGSAERTDLDSATVSDSVQAAPDVAPQSDTASTDQVPDVAASTERRPPVRPRTRTSASAPAYGRRHPAQPRRDTPQREAERIEASAPAEAMAERDGGDPQWLVSGPLRMCPVTGEVLMGRRRVSLEEPELRVLELMMTKGGSGLSAQSIVQAAGIDLDDDDQTAADALISQVRRKTGVRGRGQTVRRERVLTYFFEDTVGQEAPQPD